jgi:hypothetical protein
MFSCFKVGLFLKEVKVYFELMPALKKFNKGLLIPGAFYGNDIEGVLVMENLKTSGFVTIQNMKGLNRDQVKLVLDQLARLHASSHHYVETYPGGLDKFTKDFPIYIKDSWLPAETKEMEEKNDKEILFGVDLMLSILKKYSKDTELTEKVVKFRDHLLKSVKGAIASKKDAFNCLLHNDAWCHNFMFR